MDKVSTITQNQILNVLVENERGTPIAQTGPHRPFLASQRIWWEAISFQQWSARQHGQTDTTLAE